MTGNPISVFSEYLSFFTEKGKLMLINRFVLLTGVRVCNLKVLKKRLKYGFNFYTLC